MPNNLGNFMIFSYSRLSLYETCPFRFYLKYILGSPEPVTKPLALGKAVHKAIELKINGMSENEAILAAIIETDFHPEVTYEEVLKLLQQAPDVKGRTEIHFKLPLDSSSGIQLQGYIDLLQDVHFWDWKSNWKPYRVHDTRQLALYAWAIMKMRGIRQVKGTLFFLRFRKAESFIYNESDGNEAREWAIQLAEQIEMKKSCLESFPDMASSLFQPTPGSHCKHCPFVLECIKK
ncbi:PD-(D/E)XK nuclease family protein [Paenibacillus silvae]|uniref:PD-(D/E)XK nuclease family protein n=1 Tax=Paenibacillus silvae TaxID=1325358 RepID=UPI0025A0F87B|nr:PD-(D/E)XK nuclease family protein [Paenibacillus silvae]MDM5277150.1 PD-(D/E)XK nuclease family protein [Paenibacillus silvae]